MEQLPKKNLSFWEELKLFSKELFNFLPSIFSFVFGCIIYAVPESKFAYSELRGALIMLSVGFTFYFLFAVLSLNTKKRISELESIIDKNAQKQDNTLRNYQQKTLNLMRTAVSKGNFYIMEGTEALLFISRNINNYTEIYNMRIRPNGECTNDLKRAISTWRLSLEKRFKKANDKLIVREIIAFDEQLQKENDELLTFYNLNKKKYKKYLINFKYCELDKGAYTKQLSNFMLLKNKKDQWELFWGGQELNDPDREKNKYLTYCTSNQEMGDDYYTRFKVLYDEKLEKEAT